MDASRDHEPVDWDAAWEALVARLERPRHERVAVAVGQVMLALAVMVVSVWLLAQLVAQPLHQLGRWGA
jgi:hypothetical protein